MEHRLGTRRPIAAAVVLHPPGATAVSGRTREVSISGMYVEAPTESFAGNSVIEVELTLPGSATLRTFRWQAMVIRKTPNGLGLMFDRLRPAGIMRLLEYLDAGLPHSVAKVADTTPTTRNTAGAVQPRI